MSDKYTDKDNFAATLRASFDKRLSRAMDEFQRHLQAEYSRPVVLKLLELLEVDDLCFYGLLNGVLCDGLEQIEDVENFNSFIDNFFDDSYVKFVLREDVWEIYHRTYTFAREGLDEEVESLTPNRNDYPDMYTLKWVSGDDGFVTPIQLIDHIDHVIDVAKNKKARLEKWEKCK